MTRHPRLAAAPRPRGPLVAVAPFAALAFAALVQCGGQAPAAPTPSLAVSSLAIVPWTDEMLTGSVVDLTLQANLRDGTTAILSPTWWTDNPGVLLVKPLSTSRTSWEPGEKVEVVDHYLRGHVTALATGVATVYADSPHGRGHQLIRVVAK
jgi:hypothetical protein